MIHRPALAAVAVSQIASNYGEVMMGFSVVLLYSSAMPILYWVAGFGFMYKYWLDKWAVLRAFRKPPLYGHDLFDSLEEVIFFMVTVHAGVGWYFLSMAGGLDPNVPVPLNWWRPHCIPMFITFIAMFSVLAVQVLYNVIMKHTEWGKHHQRTAKNLMKLLKINDVGKLAADALEHTVSTTAGMLHIGGMNEEQQAKKEEAEEAHKQGDKGEVLGLFSEVLAQGIIVNEDDDYHMDEHENSRELELAFMERIHAKWEALNNTFEDPNRLKFGMSTSLSRDEALSQASQLLAGERPSVPETGGSALIAHLHLSVAIGTQVIVDSLCAHTVYYGRSLYALSPCACPPSMAAALCVPLHSREHGQGAPATALSVPRRGHRAPARLLTNPAECITTCVR